MNLALALALILSPGPADSPGDLVKRLGSARFADREAASEKLEALGEIGLPAIEAAIDDPDPEVRIRASGLRSRVEVASLRRPTPVKLDLERATINRAIASFSAPGGCRICWAPGAADKPANLISLHEPATVPFWTAIDRICGAGDLHYLPSGPKTSRIGGGPQPCIYLAPGAEERPRADFGPIRMEMVGIRQYRSINLVPHPTEGPDGPPDPFVNPPFGARHASLSVELRMLVEPRMLIQRYGDALVVEAVDGKGRKLTREDLPHVERWGIALQIPSHACVEGLSLRLLCPIQPVRSIGRLSLRVPVEVVAPRRTPWMTRINRAGKGDSPRIGSPVRFEGIDETDRQFPRLRFSLASNERIPQFLALGGGLDGNGDDREGRPVRPEVTPDVLQVLDGRGQIIPWHEWPTVGDDDSGRLMLDLQLDARSPRPGDDQPPSIPDRIIYHEYARSTIMASFEFRDVVAPVEERP